MSLRVTRITTLGVIAVALYACSNTATSPGVQTSLVSVSPSGGATSVSTSSSVQVRFNHAMASGMEMFVSLHEGDVTGPVVACTATWSNGRDTLTLMPSTPLKPATRYTLHLGGRMKDANGNVVDMSQYGSVMGGQWASASMMNGGGMMGGGGPMSGQEMGTGWAGTNGMYGMVFSFTTS